MTGLGVVIRFHGQVKLDLRDHGPRAALSVGAAEVHIELDAGTRFTYPREDVTWNPLDDRTVRIDLGDERVFFTGDQELDFGQLSDPIPNLNRRLPALPSIESAWIEVEHSPDLFVAGGDPDHSRSRRGRCTHDWRELRLTGGIFRRVCNVCGEVSLEPAPVALDRPLMETAVG